MATVTVPSLVFTVDVSQWRGAHSVCKVHSVYNSIHTYTRAYTHPHGARTVEPHCLIGGPTSLGGQSRERGGNISPYYAIRGKLPNRCVLFSKMEQDSYCH